VQSNSQQQTQSTPEGKVSGHVFRSDTGAPLHKATVILSGGRRQVGGQQTEKTETTRTALDGSYVFADVPSGDYTLRMDHSGYVGQFYGQSGAISTGISIRVGAGQNLENLDVHLTPAGVISGTVYDEDNEPLEGMQISAVQLRYSRGGQQVEVPVDSTRTDDLGNYRLSGLKPGSYYVRTGGGGGRGGGISVSDSRDGTSYGTRYYPGTRSLEGAQKVQLGSGAEAHGIQISVLPEKTYHISGTIIDGTDGSGQRRYTVTAARLNGGNPNEPIGSGSIVISSGNGVFIAAGAPVNPDGTFVLEGLPSGDYLLTARAIDQNQQGGRGNPPPRVDIGNATVRVSDGDAHAVIQIGRAAEVRGQVVVENPPGPSFTSFRISLQGQSAAGGRGGPAGVALDANGAFDIKEIQPGRYTFNLQGGPQGSYTKRAICAGRDTTFQPIVLEPNSVLSDCTITLATDAGTLSGQVLDGTKPAPGLMVLAIPQSLQQRQVARYTMTASSDGNGLYVITGVIPGDYYLFAVLPDEEQSYFALDYPERNQANAENVTVKSGESKTVNLKPSTPQ